MEKEDLMFISNITQAVPDDEYVLFEHMYDILDATVRLTNACMFVIDFSKNELVYRSKNLIFVDEATMKDFQRDCPNPYWSLIVEDDFDILVKTRKAYYEVVDKFSHEDKLNHTVVTDYRIMLRNRPFTITQKFSPLAIREDGSLWLGLFLITHSPNKKCEHIALFGKNFRYVYDFNCRRFVTFMENMNLTKMEKAILSMSAKGLTTEQIAEELCRSVNTIKTHKKRLFKKLHVQSIAEALTFVSNYNL